MNRAVLILITGILMVSNVSADLVAYWPLNEGSGQTVNDLSGNANNGILGQNDTEDAADPQWLTDPQRGTVLGFAGDTAGQWVNLDAMVSSFASLNAGTISAWIKMDGSEAVDTIVAISDASDGSSESRFAYEGKLFYDVREQDASPIAEDGQVLGGTDVIDNNWHHVAVTVTEDALCVIYVDGMMKETGAEPFFAAIKDADTMSIGRNVDSGGSQWHFKGQMSQVAIFDTALTASQVQALSNGVDVLNVVNIARDPSPADKTSHIAVDAELTWNGADNIASPKFNVYGGQSMPLPEMPLTANLTTNNFAPDSLAVGTTYFWRVDVVDDDNVITGPLWQFTTIGKAAAPSPTNQAVAIYTRTELSWTGDSSIASYKLYIGTNQNDLQFKETLTETSYSGKELQGTTTYYWRVDSYDADQQLIATGDIWSFTTDVKGAIFEQIDVFVGGTEGYNTYRIPVIMQTMQGTILAFCEGRKNNSADHGDIDLVMKRSTDGGKTFSALTMIYEEGDTANITIGNPCPVQDKSNGRIWMPFNRDNDDVLIMYSDDDGLTWSTPVDITADVKDSSWSWYACGPAIGIQLEIGKHAGRLVIPCDHRSATGFGSHTIYSDDHGKTWKRSEPILPGCNECQAVELTDGKVMMNMRAYTPRGYRAVSISEDGGATWSDIYHDQALPEPTCQGSIMRYTLESKQDKNRILFSNPASSSRVNMTIKMSYDEGKTWPVAKTIYAPSSAYSCLTQLGDNLIGCLYERDGYTKITLARVSLEWLTDGHDSIVVCEPPLQADLDGDCIVNLRDFEIFACHWLECNFEPVEACSVARKD
ncbi:MAG: exo-alpha-sialidase [Phycisphaerae bacterium]|nr:exo-alpha-sialidase [Phycisphaerae bacterium]